MAEYYAGNRLKANFPTAAKRGRAASLFSPPMPLSAAGFP
jgi:hypothetical protein